MPTVVFLGGDGRGEEIHRSWKREGEKRLLFLLRGKMFQTNPKWTLIEMWDYLHVCKHTATFLPPLSLLFISVTKWGKCHCCSYIFPGSSYQLDVNTRP